MNELEEIHPHPGALELYVLGAHEELPVEQLEAHLRRCPRCLDEVRRQAQLELTLTELAAQAQFCPACARVLLDSRCSHCGAVAAVGDFRIEKVLVQNAHGRMYLARDPAGRAVALKELAFVQPPHPDALAAFERESRLLRQLNHPQIPRFVASFSTGEGVNTRLYLAQEYVEGESLLAHLASHQFCEEEAREVALQVLAVLEYLQSLSPLVTHRDIKPANLIRRADGRIALVDFGAARDLGPTAGATLVGTFGYMPLEQMGGIVDATTDLYALGATLCHLLSRREPWSFLDDPQALSRLNVSAGFRQYLGKLLARRPGDRYLSARAALAALRHRLSRRRFLPSFERPRFLRGAVALSLIAAAAGGALTMLLPPVRERHPGTTVAASTRLRNPVPVPTLPREFIAADGYELRAMAESIEASTALAGVSAEYARGMTNRLQREVAPGQPMYPVATYYFIVRAAGMRLDRDVASADLARAHRNGGLLRWRDLPAVDPVDSDRPRIRRGPRRMAVDPFRAVGNPPFRAVGDPVLPSNPYSATQP